MPNKRLIWVMTLSGIVLSGVALVTLRGAAHAAPPTASTGATVPGGAASGRPNAAAPAAPPTAPAHPAPSAPEESATIADDPTTAPDPAQSADNNVSFPSDI